MTLTYGTARFRASERRSRLTLVRDSRTVSSPARACEFFPRISSCEHSTLKNHSILPAQRAISAVASPTRVATPPHVHATAHRMQSTPRSPVSSIPFLHSKSPPTKDVTGGHQHVLETDNAPCQRRPPGVLSVRLIARIAIY